MKKIALVSLGVVLAAGVVLALVRLVGSGGVPSGDDAPSAQRNPRLAADGGNTAGRPHAVGGQRKTRTSVRETEEDDEDEPNRSPEEKKLAADIEKALDEEDFELAKKCAPLALASKDTEIRQSMVDTLGWFGEKAIPELTPFIADPDEDVAQSAMNEWESAVASVENDAEKIGMVEMAMQVISDDDALESISNEYIGVDEKMAVESLLRIIEGGGCAKGIEKAKETYEFVTGDAFVNRAAAEKWIAEEYTPPGV